MTRPLRSLINTIGLVVAIVTSLVVPSGFLLYGYMNASHRLAFKAHLSAIRIAQYIYTHDHLWQYHQIRLFEQIQLVTVDEEIIQQKIYTNDDKLVLEDGPPLAAPVITRRATIIVSGTTRGYIDVAASFRDTLYWAMLVAVLSSLLGSTIYFALRTLPLRVLDRTLGALNDAQRRLLVQNERFDLALTNMSQGLCMFDADGKLIIFNSRFAEIYGLSLDEIKPGMTMRELMALAFRGGKSPDVDLEGTLALQRNCVREGKAGSLVEHLKDARSISIVYRPTPDGGLVATFEDITERLLAEEK